MTGYTRVYAEKLFEAIQTLSDCELRVWLALVAHANLEGKCWPTLASLSAITGFRQEDVSKHLDALAAKNFIEFVRRGQRDPDTGTMLRNVYFVEGVVLGRKADSRFELETGVITPPRTDSINKAKGTKQEKTPPPEDSFEVEVPKQEKTPEKAPEKRPAAARSAAPARSAIPNPPNPVPPPPAPRPQFYTGPLDEWAQPLPDVQEQVATTLYDHVERKMTIRGARRLVAKHGQERVDWALAHLAKQKDVFNPPGYVTALLERRAIEQVDAEPVDPGLKYITGAFADYIDH